MSKHIRWRWKEKDFGYRFTSGKGKKSKDHYQANTFDSFYIVQKKHRKIKPDIFTELSLLATEHPSPKIVAIPWNNYEKRDYNWIQTDQGVCLNYAGCLDKEEIDRREDEGVAAALELVSNKVDTLSTIPLTKELIQKIHVALMGKIYPFAGQWRTVSLHKGTGPEKWPLPRGGIAPQMDVIERDVFSRSPFLSDDDTEVFAYTSEVMNELLAIHPFREGNGRTAFLVANLILMQNEMVPLDSYSRRRDEERYFAACEEGRINRNYKPLTILIEEWEDEAKSRWEKM